MPPSRFPFPLRPHKTNGVKLESPSPGTFWSGRTERAGQGAGGGGSTCASPETLRPPVSPLSGWDGEALETREKGQHAGAGSETNGEFRSLERLPLPCPWVSSGSHWAQPLRAQALGPWLRGRPRLWGNTPGLGGDRTPEGTRGLGRGLSPVTCCDRKHPQQPPPRGPSPGKEGGRGPPRPAPAPPALGSCARPSSHVCEA